jgi:hypothetical protein
MECLFSRMRDCGKRLGVHVYPHRLRHTCATQLLNAGCRITSIQRFLGHKKLNTTMIYARAHDQTVAEDYFTAMERVEQRLEIVPKAEHEIAYEDVKVQTAISNPPQPIRVFQLIERLESPELCFEERFDIAFQLREVFAPVLERAP